MNTIFVETSLGAQIPGEGEAMRRKIETLLDERLLKRAKGRAAREGKVLNELLEAALEAYLTRRPVRSSQRLVDEGWGAFRVTRRQLAEAMKGEPN